MAEDVEKQLREALWRVYRRPDPPPAWTGGGNLPWNDPTFAERMLREHLDDAHGAASRRTAEREAQLQWLWAKLALAPGKRVYDVTCGPGLYATELAQRGCEVLGVDFSPASIRHARELAARLGVHERCRFIEADIRSADPGAHDFDAALFLYGQLAVFPRDEAAQLAHDVCALLAPGGRLIVELLNVDHVDKKRGSWWFTDHTGLWGNAPFLHLGERFWDEESGIATERFHIIHLDTGEADEIVLCDQTYSEDAARALLLDAGFETVDTYPAWDHVDVQDAREWMVYVATKPG